MPGYVTVVSSNAQVPDLGVSQSYGPHEGDKPIFGQCTRGDPCLEKHPGSVNVQHQMLSRSDLRLS